MNLAEDDLINSNSKAQRAQIRRNSLYSNYYTWNLGNYMVKWGDDVRQEQFAMQMIYEFKSIFEKKKLKLRLTPYEIIPIGPEACLVEMVEEAISLDGLKKNLQKKYKKKVSLFEFFGSYYKSVKARKKARTNFCYSLAAYSLLCYFLQLKDRHNGNILLHRDGRIVHIDFGFLFTTSPGGSIEKSVPFKLVSEYVAVMGDKLREFEIEFKRGFEAVCEHRERILSLFRMMAVTAGKPVECMENTLLAYRELEARLNPPRDHKERRKLINL